MFTPPERVVFEQKSDIIDYVTRGLPPTKKNFDRVMAVVYNPLTDEEVENSTAKDVVISRRIFDSVDENEFAEILKQIHANRIRNRNIAIGAFIFNTIAAIMITAKVFSSDKEESSCELIELDEPDKCDEPDENE